MELLVLTDHSKHSDQNSAYAFIQGCVKHPEITTTWVASRGIDKNNGFFTDQKPNLFGVKANASFAFSEDGAAFQKGLSLIDLNKIQLVLLRLPRPISDEFLMWIERLFKHAKIFNRPSGIIETSTKAFLLQFPALCPPMALCKSKDDVYAFAKRGPMVLKPLTDYGGNGIAKIEDQRVEVDDQHLTLDDYLNAIEGSLQNQGLLAMQFLKNVSKGDKRILVVDGQIVGCSLRIPQDGNWLCNVSKGVISVPSSATEEEVVIVKTIAPKLKDLGIIMYGVDTLVDDHNKRILSEINTLSIGGFMQAEQQHNTSIIEPFINKIIRHAQ